MPSMSDAAAQRYVGIPVCKLVYWVPVVSLAFLIVFSMVIAFGFGEFGKSGVFPFLSEVSDLRDHKGLEESYYVYSWLITLVSAFLFLISYLICSFTYLLEPSPWITVAWVVSCISSIAMGLSSSFCLSCSRDAHAFFTGLFFVTNVLFSFIIVYLLRSRAGAATWWFMAKIFFMIPFAILTGYHFAYEDRDHPDRAIQTVRGLLEYLIIITAHMFLAAFGPLMEQRGITWNLVADAEAAAHDGNTDRSLFAIDSPHASPRAKRTQSRLPLMSRIFGGGGGSSAGSERGGDVVL